MGFRIEQSEEYQGQDRWRWAVWLEDTESELNRIESVIWKLHHTFPQPVVEVTNRPEKFRIERVGWGTFRLAAEVRLKSGESIPLTHQLRLTCPEEAQPRSRGLEKGGEKRVFLSFSAEDQRFAAIMKEELEKAGLRVKGSLDLSSGEPWAVTQRKLIQESDVFAMLVTSDPPSQCILDEQKAAAEAGLPMIALIKEGLEFGAADKGIERLEFTKDNLREMVQGLLSRVKGIL